MAAELRPIFSASLDSLLAPIRAYLDDEEVTEILINAPDQVYVERCGCMEEVGARFDGADHVAAACRNLAESVGLLFDDGGCRIDGRLPNGSRFHILHGPSVSAGTVIAIRRFHQRRLTLDELVARDMLDRDVAAYLRRAVDEEKNVVVSGSTGTGKTTLLGALVGRLPPHLRVIVIEDARELVLPLPHVVYLEARPAHDGRPAVTVRDLLHSSLRLRPDRLIVGEVRGAEALDLIAALTSGHGGSFSTLHASSPETALARLETMALLALPTLGIQALRHQVASAIEVVVQLTRTRAGRRVVTCVAEIAGIGADGSPVIRRVFTRSAER